MVEGELPVPALSRVVVGHRPEPRSCHVTPVGGWHVGGSDPCTTPTCGTHYGLCLPVSTHLLDPKTRFGVLDLDVEAIKEILSPRDHQPSPSPFSPFPHCLSSPRVPLVGSPELGSQGRTVADLATPKRSAGRLPGAGAPDPSPTTTSSSPQQRKGSRTPPSPGGGHLFSLELMQTDDVSTIAAQIANQAELIYQAWKTTDLNPSDLIHYHSVSSHPDRASLSPTGSFHSNPASPPVSVSPRIPVRNISPAPLGASPAVPRRVIDIPITTTTDRPANVFHKGGFQQPSQHPGLHHPGAQHHVPQHQGSPHHHVAQPIDQHQGQPHPSAGSHGQPAASQHQKQPHQQFLHQQHPQYQAPKQQQPPFHHSPTLSQQQQSPARSLNASPRPYVPPGGSDGHGSPLSPRILNSSPSPASPGVGSSPRGFQARGVSPHQPPPPPERSSSYVEPGPAPPPGAGGDSDIEATLRELVTTFVMEDKARHAGGNGNAAGPLRGGGAGEGRPKSAPPSSIQDALNRFERQMAITSRVPSGDVTHNQSVPPSMTSAHLVTSLSPTPTTTQPKMYSASPRDPGPAQGEPWNRRELEGRARRSISPNPVVSQPGWNEPPPVNTSTWPLKNKQPSPDKRVLASSPAPVATPPLHSTLGQSASLSGSAGSVLNPTSYITTLEAHVDSQGRSPGVPIRHKVVAMPGVTNKEEEKLLQSLRRTPLLEDKDSLRPMDASPRGLSTVDGAPKSKQGTPTPTTVGSITPRGSPGGTSKPKKFSISVTVDVENQTASPEPPMGQGSPPQGPSGADPAPHSWGPGGSNRVVESLSAVDYAKVRYQDAQDRPRTSQRLEDYKSFSPKAPPNGDGRVMQAKTRFEVPEVPAPEGTEVPWRTVPPAPVGGEVGSTLPEFYKRKLRKMRKMGSPEPLHALAALPHPQLTDQQKAHIRERSQSPTVALGASTAVRPFLTQGSVAERVLLFEKAPGELKKVASSTPGAERRRPAFSTWRDPDEVRTKAQDVIPTPPSPPRALEIRPTSPPSATVPAKPSHLREPLAASVANKENARPIPSSASSQSSPAAPSAPAPAPSGGPMSPTSPLGIGGTGLATPIPTRAPGRRMPKSSKNILIPRFYYPMGRPLPQPSQEQSLERVSQCFRDHGGQIQRDNMEPLMRACQVPLYWKAPLFLAAGGEALGHLSEERFMDYWGRLIASCHDASSRFVRVLSRGLRGHLVPEDFLPLVQDVVDTHPGLTFLKEATEFHSRYVHTVIARIYYCVNRSWSGKITIPELRRSNLLQVISYLEEEEDINKITDYFSYEHFYVIYCKFWELDTDHDLFIDRNDLAKHNERALSDKIIDRIFSGAVTRGRVQKQDRMGYQEFVWFLISEEDKRHPTAIEYWFRCMDLDGDGFLSMYELEYFYEDQLQRMEALGIETLPFSDCLCQMLDMVRPAESDRISLSDLKKCRMTPVFFDTFFNFDKYFDHEQRDPFASHRMDDEGPETSDWDRYAAVEYELLVAEEGGDSQDDMLYGDEDELSMGVDSVLDGTDCELGVIGTDLELMGAGGLKKHSSLSNTVPNLALDHMDVDEDYSDYAESDDYQY